MCNMNVFPQEEPLFLPPEIFLPHSYDFDCFRMWMFVISVWDPPCNLGIRSLGELWVIAKQDTEE